MNNKEILKSIVLEDEIENISFGETTFTIFLGDILNRDSMGNTYKLLETYIQVPYDFTPSNLKLHRGIVDVLECDDRYNYSGFVHYNGNNFCYGASNVDRTCNIIRDEGLTSDLFNRLLIEFNNYLSVSSHGTTGSYRKINLNNNIREVKNKVKDIVTVNNINFPRTIEQITKQSVITGIKYDEPYVVLREVPTKAFSYNNENIIPKIVTHRQIIEEQEVSTILPAVPSEIHKQIKNKLINNYNDEVNSKTRFSAENFIHQLTDKYNRVDGSFYI